MKKILSRILIGCVALGVLSLSFAALTIGWFVGPGGKTDDQAIDGSVGLRGYFHGGTGTKLDPYEITTPEHFYNLMRLQNLGIFPEKQYFRVGHIFNQGDGYQCINTGPTDPNDPDYVASQYVDFLDMKPLQNMIINPIGSEATPFLGDFNGNGIPVRNLKITGYPDDIGVFGYVAKEASVEGLVCEGLKITSLGYSDKNKQDFASDADYELYHADIDELFGGATHKFARDTNLNFYDWNGSGYTALKADGLKGANGGGSVVLNLDKNTQLMAPIMIPDPNDETKEIVSHIYHKGYFEATFPNEQDDPFTYSWNSSSPLIKEVMKKDIIGGTSEEKVMAFDLADISVIPEDPSDTDFNNGRSNMQIDARISLVASHTDKDGFVYSRVIQTYKCEFNSNSSQFGDGNFSVTICCDYLNRGVTGDRFTNYKHGNNIGFLAGHVDGSIKNCFVFGGQLEFNNENQFCVVTESETGLVGEIGTNVVGGIDDKIGKKVHGEIGSMNFSKIYSLIRDDMKPGVKINAGYNDSDQSSFVSYQRYLKDGNARQSDTPVLIPGTEDQYNYYETVQTASGSVVINHGSSNTYGSFSKFLRHSSYGGIHEYITSSGDASMDVDEGVDMWHEYTPTSIPNIFNSVDFLWNELIEDEKAVYDDDNQLVKAAVDRGLGVFKITTYKNDTAAAHKYDNEYGTYVTTDLGKSTIRNGNAYDKVYFSTAEYDYTQDNTKNSSFSPLRATTLPSYVEDIHTFDYPFSRDYNYVFELDLSQTNTLSAKNKYHMWDTTSPFLSNYLSSVLVDRFGAPITKSGANSAQFGFMFISDEAEQLDSLSSYMPVGVPGNKIGFDDDEDGTNDRYYPSNSIVFRIENENGANVSIVGKGANDITIFKYDSTNASNNSQTGGPSALYKMKSTTSSSYDSHRYFEYDAESDLNTSNTTSTATRYNGMGDGGALYGHIFHIKEPGDYVVGTESGTAQVYFLAVQGQTDASVGANENIINVGDSVADVDFITEAPTTAKYLNDIAHPEDNYLGRKYF